MIAPPTTAYTKVVQGALLSKIVLIEFTIQIEQNESWHFRRTIANDLAFSLYFPIPYLA